MKKTIIQILLLIILLPILVNAETCDTDKISISSIIVNNKSDTVEELDKATVTGKNINLNVSMYNVGDNIEYKILVKNDSNEDYELENNMSSMSSDYINYTLNSEDNTNIVKAKTSKVVYLKINYANEVPEDKFESGTFNDNKSMIINLSTEDIIKNPNTGTQLYLLLFNIIVLVSILLYILYKKKKYKKIMILIISLSIIIPIGVYAVCKCEINISSNVIITKDTRMKATDVIKNIVRDANQNSTNVITGKEVSDSCENKLAYDGTSDNNLRYVGYNPCNYVSFNDEVWRIIGVMNNVDDGTGKKETRIKIIRAEPLLGYYSWDSSSSEINSGTGVNDWSKADLMNELNGDYLNYNLTENTYWYNGRNNKKTEIYDYTSGLKQKAQGMIGDAKWYLGGSDYSGIKASEFYLAERSQNVWGNTSGQICNDGACPRTTNWVGKVALIYPSDYGFAVGDTRSLNGNRITGSRSECLEKPLNRFLGQFCYLNDWLWKYDNQRLLTPSTINAHSGFYIWGSAGDEDNGNIVNYYDDLTETLLIYPVVYLKENVYITNGDGSLENPYEFN